ncbi:MAG: hypothetical protein WBA44_13095 [Mesorhizobium sp.]
MIRQEHSVEREAVVANAIREFVSELRLVEIADYIAFIRMERFGNIADLVDSAAELYFMPGTVTLGHGGEAHVGWTGEPRIVLDIELKPAGVDVYFALTMTANHACVEVNYITFDTPDGDPAANTRFLETALLQSRIVKTPPVEGMRPSV